MLKNTFILFLLLFYATLFAQEPIHYTTKQGLPTNHVYDVAEDADGFMWFATKQGLVKYDGETFRTITIQDGLPNNDTWLIEPDLQGRLWYFSKSQFQGYIKNDSIYKFRTKKREVVTPRFLYKTKDSLWFFGSSGLQTFNQTNITNERFCIPGQDHNSFRNHISLNQKDNGTGLESVLATFINPETKEYILFTENKLLIYDFECNFRREIKLDLPLSYKRKIDNNGLLYNQIGYLATQKGVFFLDFKSYTVVYKSYKELIDVEETRYFRCRALANEFQISIPGHLMIFDYALHLKSTYKFSKDLGRSSYKDSNGNIWLIDLANGVSLLNNSNIESAYYLKDLKVQKINNLNNQLLAGVNEKGFYRFNGSKKYFEQIVPLNRPNSEIYQINRDQISGNSYLISSTSSYKLVNKEVKEIRLKRPKNFIGVIPPSSFKDIITFNDFDYYIGSNLIFKKEASSLNTELGAKKTGLLTAKVLNNQLIIGGSDGLFQLLNDSLVKSAIDNELLNTSVLHLTVDTKYGYVATDGKGVYLYNKNNLQHIKATDGLSVQRIIKKDNKLWLATQKGIKKVNLDYDDLTQSKISDEFYESDGLLANNTNDIYIEDNFLYAASDQGLAKINLSNSIYNNAPNLYFKTKKDTLIFKNGERDNVSITFALQDYVNQDHTSFNYRLTPLQNEWKATETKTLNFSNLSPGIYSLEVEATDQHKNKSIKVQYLNIIPAWRQTTLAKIGFILCGLLGLFLLYKFTKERIRKKEKGMAQQEKRVASVELQALRSQMNPHFVHNSLNAIQYFIQRNEVELSENYLSKFSQLIRLFFDYSRRQTISIKEELELLTKYLDIEKLRFEEKLQYEITVCDEIDTEEQQIPSMLLQPLVENAVNHGIFHKKGNGKVTVDFKQLKENRYQVIVKDDGIGINKSKKIFNSSSKNYKSNSSKVLYERLDLLNKSKTWIIAYDAQDLSGCEPDKTGTIVTLLFKKNHIE